MRLFLRRLVTPLFLASVTRMLRRRWRPSTARLRHAAAFAAILFVMPAVAGGRDMISASAGPVHQLKQGNIPNEVPMPMMQFPPLMSMHFPKVKVLEVVPAADFLDGSDLYRRNCSECHGIQTTSQIRGIRFDQISSAVAKNKPGIDKMQLNKDEFMAIIDALKKSPTS